MSNHIDQSLQQLSKEELISAYPITGLTMEPFIARKHNLIHNTEINGTDAYCENGHPYEIKTQLYSGNYRLRGRAKYGFPSPAILHHKLKSNEKQIVVGICAFSHVQFYDFEFTFDAIREQYDYAISMGWGNCDVLPKHYSNHSSFKYKPFETVAFFE